MADLIDVENAVATLLKTVTPARDLIQGRAGEGPAPSSPAAMWVLESVEMPDHMHREYTDADQIVIATGSRLEFLIEFFGGSAMADAVRFNLSLRQTQRTADLYKLCGLSGTDTPRNLSAVELGSYHQRAQMRLYVWTSLDLTAPAELMDSVQVQVNEQNLGYNG